MTNMTSCSLSPRLLLAAAHAVKLMGLDDDHGLDRINPCGFF